MGCRNCYGNRELAALARIRRRSTMQGFGGGFGDGDLFSTILGPLTSILGGGQKAAPPPPPPPPQGLSTGAVIAIVGGAVGVLAIGAVILTRKKK